MKYHLRFRPEVVADLETAAKWYDGRSLGLGSAFLGECKSALDNIVDNFSISSAPEMPEYNFFTIGRK